MGFADLKKNRANRFEGLIKKIGDKEKTTYENNTPDYWKPTVDKKSQRATAVIRFLPEVGEEALPYIKYWDHYFEGPKGWYIENSLTTIGKEDPVSEYNSELWQTGIDANKDLARKYKRRLNYVANVYIIQDHGDPSNNGTVRKFRFGKKIWDKLNEAMAPEFPGQQPINPFDLWDGANFNLIMNKNGQFWSYDSSTFASPGPLANSDKAMKEIYDSAEPLEPIIDPSKFKSYDALKARFYKVLGLAEGEKPVIEEASIVETVEAETAETVAAVETLEIEASVGDVIDVSPDIDDELSVFEDLVK